MAALTSRKRFLFLGTDGFAAEQADTAELKIGGLQITNFAAGVAHFDADGIVSSSSVVTADIGSKAVTSAKIADGAVGDDQLAGSIPDSKLASNGDLAKLAGTQTFSGAKTFSESVTLSKGATIPAGYDLTITDAPGSNTDAANKKYVDDSVAAAAAGLDYKQEAKWYWDLSLNEQYFSEDGQPPAAATKDVILAKANELGASGPFSAGERILLNDTSAANVDAGLWVFSGSKGSLTLARTADMPGAGSATGAWVYAMNTLSLSQNQPPATVVINTAYVCNTPAATTGTTPIQFTLYSRAESITASGVLAKTGLDIAVNIGAGLYNNGSYLTVRAGQGIKHDSTNSNAVAIKRATYSGLAIDNDSALKVDATSGVEVDGTSGKVVVKLANNPGLEIDGASQGVKVKVGSGVELDQSSGALKAKVTSGLQLDSDYIKLKLASDKGLEITGGTDLQIKADTSKGIALSSSGVAVDLASQAGLEFSSGKLKVKPGDALKIDPTGGELDLMVGDGLQIGTNNGDSIVKVKMASNDAVHINPSQEIALRVDGSTIIKDSGNNYQLTFGTLPLTFKIASTATSANVTAPNLDTLTAGGSSGSSGDATSLHRHDAVRAQITRSGTSLTAGDAVTVNSSGGLIKADKSDGKIVGVAVADNGGQAVLALSGVASLTPPDGAAAGDTLYLGASGALVLSYSGFSSGDKIVKVGRYLGNNKMAVAIQDVGTKA